MLATSRGRLAWAVALSAVTGTHSLPQWQAAVHMFLQLLVHSLQETEWAKRTLSSRDWGPVLWFQIAVTDQKDVAYCTSRIVRRPSPPLAKVTSRGFKMSKHFCLSSMFFSPFGSQTFKTRTLRRNWIYKLTSHTGSERTQKDLEFIPQVNLWHIYNL